LKDIVLATLNGRYTHSSIALRYLFANLHELQDKAIIKEFVINENIQDIVEKILIYKPKIVGLGVYIWNAQDISQIVNTIKLVSPSTKVVLGGPEVSYEPFRIDFSKADYIIQGEGEVQFYELCKGLLEDQKIEQKIFPPKIVDINTIQLPYSHYNDNDIKNRYIYLEASRGCPYRCEFCLSSIDKKVREFDTKTILDEISMLWDKGVRNFKFIDRTFNLNIENAKMILEFFLQKKEHYLAHFEVIPDNFPDELKLLIKQFPPATLQLEVGIQTLKKDIAKNIKRNLKIEKIKKNIAFLENETKAHIHLDLIIGLPGESCESFGENLDFLCSISNSEIQVGILKKLSGTTINRHDEIYGMVYNPLPPYDILSNNLIPFSKMQDMKRFARFWDLVYNSGNFTNSFKLLTLDKSVYEVFLEFSKWLYTQTHSTWKIALDRLAFYIFEFLTTIQQKDKQLVADTILADILKVGGRKVPKFLHPYTNLRQSKREDKINTKNKRQLKHVL
jgi:radical SAM superfamily enzyme YgiQ (UPF0313 family)